jgi:hypothetical protein
MSGPYTVTIKPRLLAEGEHKGHLEYLHFTATDGTHEHRWWAVNTGMLADEFSAIFGDWGAGILERLRKGETSSCHEHLRLMKFAGRLVYPETTDRSRSLVGL